MRNAILTLLAALVISPTAGADAQTTPACAARPAPGSIPAMVCADPELAALDRQLNQVYAAASRRANNEHPPRLKAEQRGWIKGRDDCWKAVDDRRACVRGNYVQRIVELQARYRLVDMKGPLRWQCDGNPAKELVVHFFATEPPSLIAELGDQSSLMTQQPAASGIHYLGRNEEYREHQGEAMVRWGYGAQPMRCTLARPAAG